MQNKTRSIALISIYAALYAVLVIFNPIPPYGPLQLRVADVLLAGIPLLGLAGVLGHTLGVFIANLYSPFIPLDLLNTMPSFIMAFIIYYVYKCTKNDYTVIGTCIAYSVVLGVTVGWMLNYVIEVPLIATITYVALGNIIASTLFGWPVFKILRRIEIQRYLGRKTC